MGITDESARYLRFADIRRACILIVGEWVIIADAQAAEEADRASEHRLISDLRCQYLLIW